LLENEYTDASRTFKTRMAGMVHSVSGWKRGVQVKL